MKEIASSPRQITEEILQTLMHGPGPDIYMYTCFATATQCLSPQLIAAIFYQVLAIYFLSGLAVPMTSGCRCTAGMRPKPTALLIAFAIRRWLTGRRPVSLPCLIRPISVMYSDIIEKFYSRVRIYIYPHPLIITILTTGVLRGGMYSVFLDRVDSKQIHRIERWRFPRSPLPLLLETQIMRRICIPLAEPMLCLY